ncbi:flowering time control protein FCA [Diospyros lotus]|uniref:flowering time control protein FCA n=1 Tax=Diospyros lotus TaxID=55363 RepID=UPI00224FA8D4|nr:flowering time control protein FCA [Diospyros lotus]
MDRHRGERYGNNADTHHYRHSRGPPRSSSDGPFNHHHRRSPANYRGGGDRHQHRPFDSPPRYPAGGGGGGGGPGGFGPVGGVGDGGFRPPDGGGFNSNHQAPLSGQKRGYSYSGRGGSPDRFDGGNFAKLFIGSVPKTATEEDIRPLFEEHGNVLEVALIKDKRTGQQQGCCFVKYATSEEADRAIRALHNQVTLPGGVGPIQVRYADGERERLGAVEHKLFVGSLNKQAKEKEVEEIFSPYGQVEDVYLMRDEMKQSRGCGFVKFSHREMAMAAINTLNGIYTMKGCDQPLTVRFADPKRPRAGESRGGPSFGGPGFGPRFPAPGVRSIPNLGDPMPGRAPSNAWQTTSPQNLGSFPNAGIQGFGNQILPRSADATMNSTLGGPPGAADGLLPGLAVSSSSLQQGFNQSLPQVPLVGQQQLSPLQKPLQSAQDLPSSLQLPQHIPSSYSQSLTSLASVQQLGQLQIPQSAGQTPFNQALPTQQLLGLSGQLTASQPPVQQNASVQQAPMNINIQPHHLSAIANQQQLPTNVQQQLLQPHQQSPSQFAQMLSQQKQTLQASFQSSQQAFSQLQHQFQLMQPSNQNPISQQSSQAAKQQAPWTGMIPQTGASTTSVASVADVPPVSSSAPVLPTTQAVVAPAKCSWTEHTSPDGHKYYYNSSTGQSTWEKPEELTLVEQQKQQQQKPSVQQPQTQMHPQSVSTQQVSQTQHAQFQAQLRYPQQLQQSSMPMSYQASGVTSHQNMQELGYIQSQGAAGSVNDPSRFQQGLHAAQDWMWKNKPSD